MLRYLEKHSHTFDPEAIQILVAALDDAWQRIQASGAEFDGHAGAAREAFAKCIVELAQEGERDSIRLVEDALLRFRP